MDNVKELGEIHKQYENIEYLLSEGLIVFNKGQLFLPEEKGYLIVRLDGKKFSSYTKGFVHPWDERIEQAMEHVCTVMCKEYKAILGYTCSDEISLVFGTRRIFEGNIRKIETLLAGFASSTFTKNITPKLDTPKLKDKLAYFDSRIIVYPSSHMMLKNIYWRQLDCRRNSISKYARSKFGHKNIQNCNSSKMLDMLRDKYCPWENLSPTRRYGYIVKGHKSYIITPKTEKMEGEIVLVDGVEHIKTIRTSYIGIAISPVSGKDIILFEELYWPDTYV